MVIVHVLEADLCDQAGGLRYVLQAADRVDVEFARPQVGFVKVLDEIENVKLRVGALPENPTNALKYNLTWSTDGLINEYGNPCEAIVKGKLKLLQPLEGYERLIIEGVEFEAFNTSGGLGTLARSMESKVKNLN